MQEMEESSSSDSQTPDYEKIAGITSQSHAAKQSHDAGRFISCITADVQPLQRFHSNSKHPTKMQSLGCNSAGFNVEP